MFFSIFVTRWFNFEKVVQALIAEKVHYLNLEQLQGIIQKVCFIEDEDEVATLLDFYHDLGMIVRHRNTVVLRAQWLIEVIRQLITIRSFNEMVSQVYKCPPPPPPPPRRTLSHPAINSLHYHCLRKTAADSFTLMIIIMF